jgi:hypothetical protein
MVKSRIILPSFGGEEQDESFFVGEESDGRFLVGVINIIIVQ